MSQTQIIYKKETEEYQTESNHRDGEVEETQLIRKEMERPSVQCLQGLQPQSYQNRKISTQKDNNGAPIVIINDSDSEHDILTMVEQLLTNNEFSNESSLFIIVPTIDNDAGKPPSGRQSTICIQMSVNPFKWRKKSKPTKLDTKTRAATAQEDVKISSKENYSYINSLPFEVLPIKNGENVFHYRDKVKDENKKKPTRNKLCQITSPGRQMKQPTQRTVHKTVQRCNVVSTDTTIDRPCCCSVCSVVPENTDSLIDDNANDLPVTIGQQFDRQHLLVSAATSVVPSCTHPQHRERSMISQMQLQLCQCTPDTFLELLQIAVQNFRIQNMQSIGCGEGARPPETQTPGPIPANTPPDPGETVQCFNSEENKKPTSACIMQQSPGQMMQHFPQTGDGYLFESNDNVEMGITHQKQPSNKQKRFYSTIGTSTSPKLECKFKNGEKLKHVKGIINEHKIEIRKKKLIQTEKVLKLNRKKQPPPEPAPEFTQEHAIRYYVLMKPELFQNVMAERQAMKQTTVMPTCPTGAIMEPPPNSAVASAFEAAPSDSQDNDDDLYRGLNFKLTCQGAASQEFGGIDCINLSRESFTPW